jgi:hypothetical protein
MKQTHKVTHSGHKVTHSGVCAWTCCQTSTGPSCPSCCQTSTGPSCPWSHIPNSLPDRVVRSERITQQRGPPRMEVPRALARTTRPAAHGRHAHPCADAPAHARFPRALLCCRGARARGHAARPSSPKPAHYSTTRPAAQPVPRWNVRRSTDRSAVCSGDRSRSQIDRIPD